MTIAYDRSVCCDLNETTMREWLVTNGMGGYAAGTIAGMLTRVEHGLLVVPFEDTITPHLLFAKIDEEVIFDERTYALGTNEYRDGTLNPVGFVHLEAFRLEEGFPVFTYRIGGLHGIMLEKRIWMPQGHHTTCIQYRVLRNQKPEQNLVRINESRFSTDHGRYHHFAEATQHTLTLTLLPLAAYRPHQALQHGRQDWHFQVQALPTRGEDEYTPASTTHFAQPGVVGCTIRATENAHPYHLLAIAHPDSQLTFIPTNVWYWHFLHRRDAEAGRAAIDDLYLPGVVRATLWPDEDTTLSIILTTEDIAEQPLRPQQLNKLYERTVEEMHQIVLRGQASQRFFGETGEAAQAYPLEPLTIAHGNGHDDAYQQGQELRRFLLQAAYRFQVDLRLPIEQEQALLFYAERPYHLPAIVADFYAQELRTRDVLIALPGLLLTTRRFEVARRLLHELAHHFHQGMLPDYWPTSRNKLAPTSYTGVDTSLWFFRALDAYLQATRDYELLDELYHRLTESINWYVQGNDAGVSVDPRDGLLRTRNNGHVLTWMNARVDDQPVTPRYGKAVEVNALWYNALSLLEEWSRHRSHERWPGSVPTYYQELLDLCHQRFRQRFWYADSGYLYDVVDGPEGDDRSIRPNQLFAITLRHSLLDEAQQTSILDTITRTLLTPYGLRTLAPEEQGYRGQLGIRQDEQLRALHQGSVWHWLLGTYVEALLTTNGLGYTYRPQHPPEKLVHEYVWRKSVQLLTPLRKLFYQGLQGMIGEVCDGDAPHQGEYYLASVLCTGELLRIYDRLGSMQINNVGENPAAASSTRH